MFLKENPKYSRNLNSDISEYNFNTWLAIGTIALLVVLQVGFIAPTLLSSTSDILILCGFLSFLVVFRVIHSIFKSVVKHSEAIDRRRLYEEETF